MTVYLDLVVLLNFLVDYLLLLGTNRLSGFPPEALRLIPAAGLGAVYSGMCMLPEFRFLSGILWRCVFLVLMAAIGFGLNRSAIRRGFVFVLLSMTMGGVALCFGRGDFLVLLLAGVCVRLLCGAAFGGRVGEREYVNVTLCYGEHTVSVVALRDTGNGLRDPITGESVLVVSGGVGKKLAGLTQYEIQNPLETMVKSPLPGLRLIPYRSVGNPGGMLLALPVEHCVMNGKRRPTLVAFSAEGLGRGEVFEALTGGAI